MEKIQEIKIRVIKRQEMQALQAADQSKGAIKKGSGSSSSNKVNTAMNSQIRILSLVTADAAMMTSLLSLLHFRKEYDE